jgi:hypothetical protein
MIYLRETFRKGLKTKVKMEIIGMPRRILVDIAESTIAIEEEMPIRRRNMARYHQDFDTESNESNDEKQVKPKRKGAKVWFDTCRKGVYYHNCYNEGHFTKECKLLIKFCQICKSDNYNANQCPNKSAVGRCPTRKIMPMNVAQVETPIIQNNKQ